MQADREEDGRRPLIVPAKSRHMLQEVNKSLSQAVRAQLTDPHTQTFDPYNMQIKGDLGVPCELSKSQPNMVDKTLLKPLKRGGYNQRAMAQIKQSLAGFQINGQTGRIIPNGYEVEVTPVNHHMLQQLTSAGLDEELASRALKITGNKSVEHAVQIIHGLANNTENQNGLTRMAGPDSLLYSRGISRKPSFEQNYRTDSPVNSENSSVRSDSPVLRQYDTTPTPLVLPRTLPLASNSRGQTPPPAVGVDSRIVSSQSHGMASTVHMIKHNMSPVQQSTMRTIHNTQSQHTLLSQRTSPMPARPMTAQSYKPSSVQPNKMVIVQEKPIVQSQQRVTCQVSSSAGDNLYPYGNSRPQSAPIYANTPVHSAPDDQDMLAAELSSMLPPGQTLPKPVAMQAWSAKQPPIFMLQARSREVQKPVLQTATAPLSPPLPPDRTDMSDNTSFVSSVQAQVNIMSSQANATFRSQHRTVEHNLVDDQSMNSALPSYNQGYGSCHGQGHGNANRMIQIHIQNQGSGNVHVHQSQMATYYPSHTRSSTPRCESPIPRTYNQSPMSVISSTSTPSTNSDIPDKPPPPYPGVVCGSNKCTLMQPVQEELDTFSAASETQSLDSGLLDVAQDLDDSSFEKLEDTHHCTSPKPERSINAAQHDLLRQETNIRHFSPQACKFFMEQHFENLMKSRKERSQRRSQLEQEMNKIHLSDEAREEVRKMLSQKESNYIRLKRAKIDKSMFMVIKQLGIGAFGEVSLVSKNDTKQLLAMKTLKKKKVPTATLR